MTFLVEALYILSTALLVPVVIGLFLLVAQSLLELGGSLCEWRERVRVRARWQAHQRELGAGRVALNALESATSVLPGYVKVYVRRAMADRCDPVFAEKHAHDLEIETAARLARLSWLIRVGPMLGLMGTLIPMGPALIRLTEANIGGMAEDLIVAFSTTVLGLLVGGIAYAIWLARRQWYAQDLADIDFLLRMWPSPEEPGSLAQVLSQTGESS